MKRNKRKKIRQQLESESIHENTVDALVERLMSTGRYDKITKHVTYSNELGCGELDVQGVVDTEVDRYFHYYEVKSRDTSTARKTARKQFKRYQLAHPLKRVKGIYVTPTCVKRLR